MNQYSRTEILFEQACNRATIIKNRFNQVALEGSSQVWAIFQIMHSTDGSRDATVRFRRRIADMMLEEKPSSSRIIKIEGGTPATAIMHKYELSAFAIKIIEAAASTTDGRIAEWHSDGEGLYVIFPRNEKQKSPNQEFTEGEKL